MISDPIAAIATAWGDAGVGVVRLSGDGVAPLAARFFPGLEKQPPRLMTHGPFVDANGRVLDQVLCVRFAAPASFTGEDVVEIHAHGGYLNLKRILETLLGAGARLARPGEFTQRAFLNGKIDLTRAEAVADLIGARAELSRRAAVRQLEGGLFEAVEDLRARVMDLCAQAEAAVDFPDEQDQIAPAREQLAQVEALLEDMRALLKTARTGRLLREGARVALVGRPNVGKSSLLNALLGSRRAIVADTRGTTRDFLEEPFQVEGFPLVLVDTAGQGDSSDAVEMEGIRRSRQQMESADLRLLVLDRSQPLEPQDRALLAGVAVPRLVVANKGDLAAAWETLEGENPLGVSCRTGQGLDALLQEILKTALGESLDQKVDAALLTRQHHEDSLRKALGFLEHVEQTLRAANLSAEFAAGDLRSALDCLGEIVGKTTREEILNLIFSKFCIGK